MRVKERPWECENVTSDLGLSGGFPLFFSSTYNRLVTPKSVYGTNVTITEIKMLEFEVPITITISAIFRWMRPEYPPMRFLIVWTPTFFCQNLLMMTFLRR